MSSRITRSRSYYSTLRESHTLPSGTAVEGLGRVESCLRSLRTVLLARG